MSEITAKIHSYESLATKDGDGVRFAVFMSGCPLRCAYCHNPDTWSGFNTQLTPQQFVDKVCRYKPYFHGGGGVTFSGGEPLLQADFIAEVAPLLADSNINYALDTSGAVELTDSVKTVVDNAELVILDLKFWDNESYNLYTCAKEINVKTDAKTDASASETDAKTDASASESDEKTDAKTAASASESDEKTDAKTAASASESDEKTDAKTNATANEKDENTDTYSSITNASSNGTDAKTVASASEANREIFDKVLKFGDYLQSIHKRVWLRTVIIPGINDNEDCIGKYISAASRWQRVESYELLAFHTLGFSKYETLGLENPLKDTPPLDASRLETLQNYLNKHFTVSK